MKHILALLAATSLSSCTAEPAYAANEPVSALPLRGTVAATDQIPVLPLGATTLQATTLGEIAAFGGAGYTVGAGAFGAVCNGTTDDHLAIQAAINAVAGADGGRIQFPAGVCYLGAAGLMITGNLMRLQGQGGSALGGNEGTVFTYSGTGVAVTIGQEGAFNYDDGVDNIQILATGAAVTSSTARGIVLNNSQYFTSHGIGVVNFEAGDGIVSQANGVNCSGSGGQCYTASNTFYDVNLYQNFQGVLSTVLNGGTGENVLGIHGGYIIGQAVSGSPVGGSIGLSLQASNGGVVENVDVETYAVCIQNGGTATAGGNRFMGTHTEFCTQHISNLSGSIHNIFMGHIPSSVASRAAVWSDAGLDNHYYGTGSGGTPAILGPLSLSPSVDQSEAFTLSSAEGTTIIDTDTAATARAFELVNGTNQYCYSDAFVTETCFLNGTTGSFILKGSLSAGAAVFTSPTNTDALDVFNAAGANTFDVTPSATASNSLVQSNNGACNIGWSGNFTGQTWKLCAYNGNLNVFDEAVQPSADGDAFEVLNAAGAHVLDVLTNTTASNSSILLAGQLSAGGINSTPIGAMTASTIKGTTLAATTSITTPYETTTATTFSGLPPSPAVGTRAFITDDNAACTFGTTASGGGSTKCPVVYNGSAWMAG